MSNNKKINKEIATLEDLLGKAEDKETTTYIERLDKSVTIRKLTMGDLAAINAFNKSRGWEDDPFRTSLGILQRGLVDPKPNYSQAESMDVGTASDIVTKISEFSGWSETALEQSRNLSEETTESI